jgi:membrane associated rhomboid family serine protease
MTDIGIIGFILIIANVLFSYKGFTNSLFFEGYKFEVDPILRQNDYTRLISSGFLHSGWPHLLFNMLSLYLFSWHLELVLGKVDFLIVYFASLIGGNLLALFIHRNHGNYSAIGASGAVCGVIFASIALLPGMGVGLLFLPITIPGWLYGVLYVLFTIYGIKSQRDNIGHEAHLGGALVGMLSVVAMQPSALTYNYFTILAIVIPTVVFLYLIATRPHFLIVDDGLFKKSSTNSYDIDHEYNEKRANTQLEIDAILEKIKKRGIESLSKKEKEFLDEYSKNVR